MSESIFSGMYDGRIVTFIDLLGFKRDVDCIDSRPGLLISIEAVLKKLVECKNNLDEARERKGVNHDARMTCFSDCVVLSYRDEPAGIMRALSDAAFVGLVALAGGYLPRGAITIGNCIHTETVVFGRALNEAVQAEKRGEMPRTILTAPALSRAKEEIEAGDGRIPDFVRFDGAVPYVHTLGTQWPHYKKIEREFKAGKIGSNSYLDAIEEQGRALPIRFQVDDARVKAKVLWMQNYVNRVVSELGLSTQYNVDVSAN